MDMPTRPGKEAKGSPSRPAFYPIVEWSRRNRWLPDWAKILMLKMVRRKIGVERFTALHDTASKQLTREQIDRRDEYLRKAGLL